MMKRPRYQHGIGAFFYVTLGLGGLCERFLVTLALGGLLGPASRLRGQNAAHAFGVRLFLACRRSIGSGPPMLALPIKSAAGRARGEGEAYCLCVDSITILTKKVKRL